MLEIEFEKELGKNYMILKGGKGIYDYSVRMVSENRVASLLPIEVSNIDGSPRYHYEIDGYTQLEKFYARTTMEYEDIEKIITSIVTLPNKLEEYLLDKDYVILSPSTIYLDAEGMPHFIYYPDDSGNFALGVKDVCTFILRKLDHQDEKAVSAGYKAFEISARENFALSDFERLFKIEKVSEKTEKEDIFSLGDDIDEIEFEGFDLFDEDDLKGLDFDEDEFCEDEESYEEKDDKKASLPAYKEKASKKNEIIEKLIKFGPFALIVLVGLFLFLSSSMSTLSLPLRIGSFLMISVAIYLISYLLKGKFVTNKK